MAAEISSYKSSCKPELVHKLEGCTDEVNGAIIIPGQNAVISISSDRSVRVWILRDSGQFWPSVCHYMGSAATSLAYTHSTRQIFVGLDNGTVAEFNLAADFNRMDAVREYHAHQGRVCSTLHSREQDWVMSAGRDKYFSFHCVQTGKRLGGYLCNSWCTALQFDEESRLVFIGDYSGVVTVCKLESNGVKFVNTFKGHSGSVRALAWDGVRNWLFSGSFDCSIFVWDIGGNRGTVYELHGHRSKVTSLIYCYDKKKLISAGEDRRLLAWDMAAARQTTPDWAESDNCQLCNRPFFWNLKSMYDQKQVGLRQHHCRRCGKAVCDYCSSKKSVLPEKGHEYPVRVCEDCYIKVTEDEKKAMASVFDNRQITNHMDFDEARKLLVTVGDDHVIKIWNVEELLNFNGGSGGSAANGS